MKALLAAPSRCFVSAILLIFLQAHNTHTNEDMYARRKSSKRGRLWNAKATIHADSIEGMTKMGDLPVNGEIKMESKIKR